MLDLFKQELPETIEVDGSSFFIQTDYKYFLRFSKIIQNKDISFNDISFMFPYEKPDNLQEAFNQLLRFMNPPKIVPKLTGGTREKVLDYEIDSDLIFAAFLEQYNINLMDKSTKMHWYIFSALLNSIRNTKLNDILGYRCYEPSSKEYKQEMQELKNQWALPQPEDEIAEKDLESFNMLFE